MGLSISFTISMLPLDLGLFYSREHTNLGLVGYAMQDTILICIKLAYEIVIYFRYNYAVISGDLLNKPYNNILQPL